ncbi:MAG: HD domain-containing protein [Acidimicrobiales bacterium]
MVPERLQQQIDFLLEIDKLKGIVRRSYVMGGARRENTAEHSWHLVMMALVLTEHADQPVDALAVLQMLAVHDLVEIDAGDTYVFDTDGGSSKAEREQVAADRIFALLPADQGAALRARWEEFEAGDSAEARFARALDRLMPLLHNVHTEGRSWQEHGIRPEQVRRLHGRIADGSIPLGLYAERLIDHAETAGFFGP